MPSGLVSRCRLRRENRACRDDCVAEHGYRSVGREPERIQGLVPSHPQSKNESPGVRSSIVATAAAIAPPRWHRSGDLIPTANQITEVSRAAAANTAIGLRAMPPSAIHTSSRPNCSARTTASTSWGAGAAGNIQTPVRGVSRFDTSLAGS